jgi:hypothetical protein
MYDHSQLLGGGPAKAVSIHCLTSRVAEWIVPDRNSFCLVRPKLEAEEAIPQTNAVVEEGVPIPLPVRPAGTGHTVVTLPPPTFDSLPLSEGLIV